MPFGVSPTGFTKKLFDDVFTDVKARVLAIPGLSRINLSRTSWPGGVLAAASGAIAEVWDAAQELYSGFDGNSASGRMLDNVMAMVGKYRLRPTPTQVVATVNLDAGTYGAGVLTASVYGNPDARYFNLRAITSAGGDSTAVFVSETAGAIPLAAGTLTVIATPIPGWNSVNNLADGVLGTDKETDAAFRARKLVFSDADVLSKETRIKRFRVYENVLDTPDGEGRPGHSFEAVIYDGSDDGSLITDEEIGLLVWLSKPAGIRTWGDVEAVFLDSLGIERTVYFSRPTVVEVWVKVYVTKGLEWSDATHPAAIKQALVDWNNKVHVPGSTVVTSSLYGPVFSVPGVFDVTSILIGESDPPVAALNLPMAYKEIPRFDVARITVVASS